MKDDTIVTAEPVNGVALKRKGPRGFGRKYVRGDVVWIEYWHRGRQYRESTGRTGRARDRAADRLLKKR